MKPNTSQAKDSLVKQFVLGMSTFKGTFTTTGRVDIIGKRLGGNNDTSLNVPEYIYPSLTTAIDALLNELNYLDKLCGNSLGA